jgi:sugar/nucleoside kinase (ribokinase family)
MGPSQKNHNQPKKYHVYGMGNALVDMEFKVEDRFLKKMAIEKGIMTLVDDHLQKNLLGELDHLHCTRACGGSAANTLIALAQLGGKGFYSYKVAKDELGQFYQKNLQENNVSMAIEKSVEVLDNSQNEMDTGKCLVLVTPDADRTMMTYLGATQTFSTHQLVEEELAQSEYLYVEGYLVTSENGRMAMKQAKEWARKHGVKVALSCSDPAIVKFFHQYLIEFIGDGLDFIFCNEKEAMGFWENDSFDVVCEKMKTFAQNFAITLGASGAKVYDGKDFYHIPSFPVKAVDTNGAGDMFAGAYLFGLTQGYSVQDAGLLASQAASEVVANMGPRLNADHVKNILQDFLSKKKIQSRVGQNSIHSNEGSVPWSQI